MGGKMKLTDLKCRSSKPKDKSYRVFDGGGLYLEIMPNNKKLWRLDPEIRLVFFDDVLHVQRIEGWHQRTAHIPHDQSFEIVQQLRLTAPLCIISFDEC